MSQNLRVIIFIILFAAIIFLPYWIYLPLIFGALAYIPFYWEAVILGFLIDSLYGGAHHGVTLNFTYGFIALALILIMIPLRTRLRLYA